MAVSLVKEHPNINTVFKDTNLSVNKYDIVNLLGKGS